MDFDKVYDFDNVEMFYPPIKKPETWWDKIKSIFVG